MAKADEPVRFTPRLEVAYGHLEIISEPAGATVFINGINSGATPFSKTDVEPDAVLNIRLIKSGYKEFGETVKVHEGTSKIIRANLFTLPKPAGETLPTPPAASTETPPAKESPPAEKPASDIPEMMKPAPLEQKEKP